MLETLSNCLNDKSFQSKYSFKTPNYHKDIKYLTIAFHSKIPIHNCSITKQIHHCICANIISNNYLDVQHSPRRQNKLTNQRQHVLLLRFYLHSIPQ